MPKRTYKPSKKSKITTGGFRARNTSRNGKKVLSRRRKKGRRSI